MQEDAQNPIFAKSSLDPGKTFNQFSRGVFKMPKRWEDDEEDTGDENTDMDNEGDEY